MKRRDRSDTGRQLYAHLPSPLATARNRTDTQRCDVYVANTAQVDLASRLGIVGDLWRAGIRADLQYDDERSLEEVGVECVEQNTLCVWFLVLDSWLCLGVEGADTRFLVIPRANRPVLKVRSVLKRSEEESEYRSLL